MFRSLVQSTLMAAALTVPIAAPLMASDAAVANPLRNEYLMAFDDVAKKARDLAAAIPEEKYGWRPAAGVRSIAEAIGHISQGNFFLSGMAGVAKPADLPELEKLTAKADVLAWLDRAIAHGRAAAESATPEQMAQEVDFFGTKTTVRGLYLRMYGHMSEHLGQLIAYARSVGVVPPWSN